MVGCTHIWQHMPGGWGFSLVVECSSSKCNILGSVLNTHTRTHAHKYSRKAGSYNDFINWGIKTAQRHILRDKIKNSGISGQWGSMPLIPRIWPEAGRSLEFEASLAYKTCSRIVRAVTQKNPVSQHQPSCLGP